MATDGPVVCGVPGPDRAMLYCTALGTGLLAGELASLTTNSFDLTDLGDATLTVVAGYSKHRRQDVLPLSRELAESLMEYLEGRALKAPVFKVPDKPAKMLKADLKKAKIDYKSDSDDFADFHALRHTFISRLVRSGVTPAVAKDLARHSTITLTMDYYTHAFVGRSSGIKWVAREQSKVRRQKWQRKRQLAGFLNVRKRAKTCQDDRQKKEGKTGVKPRS